VGRNQIHALSPVLGAHSEVAIGNRKERIKFFAPRHDRDEAPRTFLAEEMSIACGSGAIRILDGQPIRSSFNERLGIQTERMLARFFAQQPAKPSPAKPASIIAQLEGSATASTSI
jgi:hypothetical protein